MYTNESARLQQAIDWYTAKHWYWMPVILLIFGITSIAMFMLTNRISEKRLVNFTFANTLMDIRISTTTAHLWLEEAVNGDTSVDKDRMWANLARAIGLAESIAERGQGENGPMAGHAKDLKLEVETGDLTLLLQQFRAIAIERLKAPEMARVG